MGIRTYRPTSPGHVSARPKILRTLQSRPLRRVCSSSGALRGGGTTMVGLRCAVAGGGHKRRLRKVDFRREKIGVPAKVAGIEYDPGGCSDCPVALP